MGSLHKPPHQARAVDQKFLSRACGSLTLGFIWGFLTIGDPNYSTLNSRILVIRTPIIGNSHLGIAATPLVEA